eukprot:ANDGO_05388.mRNA.1 Varicose-related protein
MSVAPNRIFTVDATPSSAKAEFRQLAIVKNSPCSYPSQLGRIIALTDNYFAYIVKRKTVRIVSRQNAKSALWDGLEERRILEMTALASSVDVFAVIFESGHLVLLSPSSGPDSVTLQASIAAETPAKGAWFSRIAASPDGTALAALVVSPNTDHPGFNPSTHTVHATTEDHSVHGGNANVTNAQLQAKMHQQTNGVENGEYSYSIVVYSVHGTTTLARRGSTGLSSPMIPTGAGNGLWTDVSFSKDGRLLAMVNTAGTLEIRDADTLAISFRYPRLGALFSVKFTRDTDCVVLGEAPSAGNNNSGCAKLFHYPTGHTLSKLLFTVAGQSKPLLWVPDTDETGQCVVVWSPNHPVIAVLTLSGSGSSLSFAAQQARTVTLEQPAISVFSIFKILDGGAGARTGLFVMTNSSFGLNSVTLQLSTSQLSSPTNLGTSSSPAPVFAAAPSPSPAPSVTAPGSGSSSAGAMNSPVPNPMPSSAAIGSGTPSLLSSAIPSILSTMFAAASISGAAGSQSPLTSSGGSAPASSVLSSGAGSSVGATGALNGPVSSQSGLAGSAHSSVAPGGPVSYLPLSAPPAASIPPPIFSSLQNSSVSQSPESAAMSSSSSWKNRPAASSAGVSTADIELLIDKRVNAYMESFQTRAIDSLKASFRQVFTETMVPSLESSVQRMFSQISTALQSGLSEEFEQFRSSAMVEIQSSVQNSVNHAVSNAFAALNKNLNSQRASTSGPAVAVQEKMDPATVVQRALDAQDFQTAFSTALSSNNLQFVIKTCSKCSAETVLASGVLAQPIVFSLLHQLCVDLTTETALKIEWIENALSVLEEPNDKLLGKARPVLTKSLENLRAANASILAMGGKTLKSYRIIMKLLPPLCVGSSQ